jgi:uncharacterized SAM-binding protein YcdF (DUF218 family)
MFFLLSKALNFFTNPLVWVFSCLLLSAFIKKARIKKRLFWGGLGLLIFFSNGFLANEIMQWWEIEPTPFTEIKKKYEWGVVLTGVTINDKEPADRVYFQHGADRVTHTVDLYKRGIIKNILISGGIGRVITDARPEADDLYKAMVLMGVPDSVLVIENKSRNTYESARNVKEFLKSKSDVESILLITSGFHMRRAVACFTRADIKTDLFTCDFYTFPRSFTPDVLIIPNAEAIHIWHKLFKEWVGIAAYWAMGYA